jgi:hypothetical protein
MKIKELLAKIKKFTSTKAFVLGASLLGLFLVSVGISVLVFTFILGKGKSGTPSSKTSDGKSKINLSLPKTESCPINGQMFTKAEKDIWETRRPITAMIENHADSRPPSGLSRADVVYEAVAEGGITRFLTVFYCDASAEDVRIGPVRSVRVYFIDWAQEYGIPLFVHSGGANNICSSCPGGIKPRGDVASEVDAFKKLVTLNWRYAQGNSMDAGTNIGFPIVWRDYERIPGAATEHTFMGSTDKLFEEGAKRGFGYKDAKGKAWTSLFTSWNFVDGKSPEAPTAKEISFSFWDNKPDYDVKWVYDSVKNVYLRFNGGKEHIDMDTKTQLSMSNVVIQFTKERGPVDKEGHMIYTTTGTGKALIFQNGGVVEGTWSKETQASRTKYFDSKSKEVSLVKGKIWVEIVPAGNTVTY